MKPLVAAALAALVLAGCGKPSTPPSQGANSLIPPATTPEQRFSTLQAYFLQGNKNAYWSCYSVASRAWYAGEIRGNWEAIRSLTGEAIESEARERGINSTALKAITLDEFAMLEYCRGMTDPATRDFIQKTAWRGAEIQGDRAVCTTTGPDGRDSKVIMVRENGGWSVDLEATTKSN